MTEKLRLAVSVDQDEDEVVIELRAGVYVLSSRMRILEGCLLLYLLDPKWVGWTEAAERFCEQIFAHDPPVGMALTDNILLLSLPHGHLLVPTSEEVRLKEALRNALAEYVESIGIE